LELNRAELQEATKMHDPYSAQLDCVTTGGDKR